MPSCIVNKCGMSTSKKSKEKNPNVRFFSFPRDEEMQKIWLTAIKRENINIKNARVCSHHFDKNCYRKDWRTEMYNYHPPTSRTLLPSAIPTLNLNIQQIEINKDSSNNIEQENFNNENFRLKRSLQLDTVLCESIPIKKQKLNKKIIKNLQQEIKRLTNENKKLKQELKKSKSQEQYEQLEDEYFELSEKFKKCVPKTEVIKILQKIFTSGQIRLLFLPHKRKIQWTAEDISSAITLRSISAKAYEFLKNKRNVPLPGQSTLRKWIGNLKLEEGILISVIQLIADKVKNMKNHEKLIILSFGQTDLSNKFNKKYESQKFLQCAMIRGIFGKWKQPIYYNYEKLFTKNNLFDLIDHLHQIGFIVVSVVSNFEEKNLKIFDDLNIGIEESKNYYFIHPKYPKSKIFVFINAPCLLKTIRNYLLDFGFDFDGKKITKNCYEKLLNFKKNEKKISDKLTENHLNVENPERQNLKLAVELFNNEIAKEIENFGIIGKLEDCNWLETAEFIKTVHNWFDIFNSNCKINENSVKNHFGMNLNDQLAKLEKMTFFMKKLENKSNDFLINLQKCVLINNYSLPKLFEFLKENYNTETFKIDYLFTNRLNTEILDQLFSYLIPKENSTDKFSPLDFKYRLRWYILGKNTDSTLINNLNNSNTSNYDLNEKNKDNPEILTKDLFQLLKKKIVNNE